VLKIILIQKVNFFNLETGQFLQQHKNSINGAEPKNRDLGKFSYTQSEGNAARVFYRKSKNPAKIFEILEISDHKDDR
jgi:hypothetical protein